MNNYSTVKTFSELRRIQSIRYMGKIPSTILNPRKRGLRSSIGNEESENAERIDRSKQELQSVF